MDKKTVRIQDKILRLMEEEGDIPVLKGFQYQTELEKELDPIDETAELVILKDVVGSEDWLMYIFVTCMNSLEVASKLKELFPTAEIEKYGTNSKKSVVMKLQGKIKYKKNGRINK